MKKRYALFAMLLCITSAFAMGQQVSVNFLPNASFSQYHTYAWGSNNANQVQDSILAQVVKQDIDSAMQSKGFTLVTEDKNPDVIVTANGGMKQQTSYQAWGMRGFGGGMGSITPQQNVIGTLIVDLFDAKTHNLLWRGIGQDTLTNNGAKNQKLVQSAVTKMFKQWPKS
jgi:Domain of unknown function (DUF4136)